MNLQQLQSMGALAPRKLTRREVAINRPVPKPETEWADPEVPEFTDETVPDTVTVFIRKGSAADAIEFVRADERSQPFVALLRFICNEDGSPVFPDLETAMRVHTWLALPLMEAAREVQGTLPNASTPRTNSGASSPSPSGDEASGSGKTP